MRVHIGLKRKPSWPSNVGATLKDTHTLTSQAPIISYFLGMHHKLVQLRRSPCFPSNKPQFIGKPGLPNFEIASKPSKKDRQVGIFFLLISRSSFLYFYLLCILELFFKVMHLCILSHYDCGFS